jgi:two-component system, sensor histidine kinase and response regulator
LRILLAEDLPANQKLMARILQRRGHTVEVADNGVEALELARSGNFDLAILDVQMPMMDGVQVTEAIRAAEEGSHAHLPIIAMTGHTLREDRDHYLQAGMDAYLAKPFDMQQFVEIVDQFGRQASPAAEADHLADPRSSGDATEKACVAFPAALRRLEGDVRLFGELAGFFVEDAPVLLEEIRAGLRQHDAKTVERAAHSLKGLVANFDSQAAVASAYAIENLAHQGRLADVPAEMEGLQREIGRLCDALEPYRAKARGAAGA